VVLVLKSHFLFFDYVKNDGKIYTKTAPTAAIPSATKQLIFFGSCSLSPGRNIYDGCRNISNKKKTHMAMNATPSLDIQKFFNPSEEIFADGGPF
jgi:hypothetical protein